MTLSNGTPLYPRAAASALNTPLRGSYGEPSPSTAQSRGDGTSWQPARSA
jgi:hypothetical protein